MSARLYHVTAWKIGDERGKGGGFGFATADRARVFVHASVLCEHLQPIYRASVPLGTVVHIETEPEKEGDRGPRARSAVCAACAAPARWEWRETGKKATDPVTGATFAEVDDVQVAGAPVYGHHQDRPTYEQRSARTAAYRAAAERQRAWERGILATRDVAAYTDVFGRPCEICADGDRHVVLRWQHGEKRTDVDVAVAVWGIEPTARAGSSIRVITLAGADRRHDIEVLVRVRGIAEPLWLRVAAVAAYDGAVTPAYVRECWGLLDNETRATVVARCRALAPDPERCADIRFDAAAAPETGLREKWARHHLRRAILHAGELTAAEKSWSGKVTVEVPESEDGYRAAGSYDSWGGYSWIQVSVTLPSEDRVIAAIEAHIGAANTGNYYTRWRLADFTTFDAGRTSSSGACSGGDPSLLTTPPEELRQRHLNVDPLDAEYGGLVPLLPKEEDAVLLPSDWTSRFATRWVARRAAEFPTDGWDTIAAWLAWHNDIAPSDAAAWTPAVVDAEYAPGATCYGVAVLNCQRNTIADPLLVSRWTRNRTEAEFWAALMLAGIPAIRAAAAVESRVRTLITEVSGGATYDIRTALYDAGDGGSKLTPAIGSPWDRGVHDGAVAWLRRVSTLLAAQRAESARLETERAAEVQQKLGAYAAIRAAVPDDAVEIDCSFGSPTNRMMRDGFWEWPVVVRDAADREIGRIVCVGGTWTASSGIAVVSSERSSGHHGGHVTLRLLVPSGAHAAHEEPRRDDPPAHSHGAQRPNGATFADMLRAKGQALVR